MREKVIMQGLASANNYIFTGQQVKAVEVISAINQLNPNNDLTKKLMNLLFYKELQMEKPNLDEYFGVFWTGESLDGKSIEVFCDQGIGDTLNLLRYLKQLKDKYDCKIVLNCYAFFNEFENFMNLQNSYIDEFTAFHVKCDYFTNIMCVSSLINKCEDEFEFSYPANFKYILKDDVPDQIPKIDYGNYLEKDLNKKRVGLTWSSNKQNPLALLKSIPMEVFENIKSDNLEFYCLQPNIECPSWIKSVEIKDILDTARLINSMDLVVSVDTAVLHLSGILNKKTLGLIHFECDPRWHKDECIWYESVELIKQTEKDDWLDVLKKVKDYLVKFSNND